MAIKTAYIPAPEINGDSIRIEGDEHHHLTVSRVEAGEHVEIFNGSGTVWTAEVLQHGRRETRLRVLGKRQVPPARWEVVLALSLVRAAAFELALEKAVEVGVTHIIPLLAARSNTKPRRRDDRWLRILVEAAKQSKRYHLPQLSEPMTLDQILEFPAASKIVFAERDGGPLQSAVAAGSPVICAVGPEGGWTDSELAAFQGGGFHAVGLGTGILKTETAAIVGAALILYALETR